MPAKEAAPHENVLVLKQRPPSENAHIPSNTRKSLDDCTTLKLVTLHPTETTNHQQTCLAILGTWDTSHVQKYLRLPPNTQNTTSTSITTNENNSPVNPPLQWVSRRQSLNHPQPPAIPVMKDRTRYHKILVSYLSQKPDTLQKLKSVVSKLPSRAREDNNNNNKAPLIIMVCNSGQAILWQNFVCAARARGISLDRLIVFCTDKEMYQLVTQTYQLAAFDVSTALGQDSIPKEAAQVTSDATFGSLVLAKVFCADLMSSLRKDFLLQDVDIVWYQDPIPYFSQMAASTYDLVFQDDGIRSRSSHGLAANTGCYYARSTPATRHYFSALIGMGERMWAEQMDQTFMNELLVEQQSARGLRVLVLPRDDERSATRTPTGWHWRRNTEYMAEMLHEKVSPVLYHNNWTREKNEKRQVFEQLGAWYVRDDCADDGGNCCLAEPVSRCHFPNFPSLVPCTD